MLYDRMCITLCKIKTGNSISGYKKDEKDKYMYIILHYFIEILSKLKCSIEIHCPSYTYHMDEMFTGIHVPDWLPVPPLECLSDIMCTEATGKL